jgi:NAD+ synthase (glutamine-hydrolysing)
VFDEKRYFNPGTEPVVVDIAGVRVGLSICEDIWEEEPTQRTVAAGAELLLNINSSPYHRGKRDERWQLVSERARQGGLPIVYVNQVGGQDELVFDGGSFAVTADGEVAAAAPNFDEGEYWLQLDFGQRPAALTGTQVYPPLDELEATWLALVLGVRDYVNKNRFRGVVLGLCWACPAVLILRSPWRWPLRPWARNGWRR